MRKEFTKREKVLLVILAVLALSALYYRVIWVGVNDRLAELEDEQFLADTAQTAAQTRLAQQNRMEEELARLESQGGAVSEIPAYDNLQNLMLHLNTVLADTLDFQLDFLPVQSEGTVLRREISMTFTVSGYPQAKEVLTQLVEGPYRCHLGDVAFYGVMDQSGGNLSLVASMTYYETISSELAQEMAEPLEE